MYVNEDIPSAEEEIADLFREINKLQSVNQLALLKMHLPELYKITKHIYIHILLYTEMLGISNKIKFVSF